MFLLSLFLSHNFKNLHKISIYECRICRYEAFCCWRFSGCCLSSSDLPHLGFSFLQVNRRTVTEAELISWILRASRLPIFYLLWIIYQHPYPDKKIKQSSHRPCLNVKEKCDQVFVKCRSFCPCSTCHVWRSIMQRSFIHFSFCFFCRSEWCFQFNIYYLWICMQTGRGRAIHSQTNQTNKSQNKSYLRTPELKRIECVSFSTQTHTHTAHLQEGL